MIISSRETSLHASLKELYSQPNNIIEQKVGKYYIDVIQDSLLIEIQTGSFGHLKGKLRSLLDFFPIKIIFPVVQERWIIKNEGQNKKIRKSPKRGTYYDAFYELVRISSFLPHPNLSIEILLICEEVVWSKEKTGSWRRKGWGILDRKLVNILSRIQLNSRDDYLKLLPESLPEIFGVQELTRLLSIPKSLAGKIIYCLRALNLIALQPDKRGKSYLYRIV